MRTDRSQLRELLRLVERTAEREIDCGEFLGRVGAYLEHLGREEPAPTASAELAQHLEVCPECREEFEALLELYLGPEKV